MYTVFAVNANTYFSNFRLFASSQENFRIFTLVAKTPLIFILLMIYSVHCVQGHNQLACSYNGNIVEVEEAVSLHIIWYLPYELTVNAI